MGFQDHVRNNVVIWLLGISLGAFGVGFGAYDTSLRVSQKDVIDKRDLAELRAKASTDSVAIQHKWLPSSAHHSCKSVCRDASLKAVESNGLSSPSNFPYFICSAEGSRKPGYNSKDNGFRCGVSTGDLNQDKDSFDCLCV